VLLGDKVGGGLALGGDEATAELITGLNWNLKSLFSALQDLQFQISLLGMFILTQGQQVLESPLHRLETMHLLLRSPLDPFYYIPLLDILYSHHVADCM